MKKVLGIVVVAIIAVVGYFMAGGKDVKEASVAAMDAATQAATEATTAVSDAATSVTDAATDAVSGTADAAGEASTAATDAVEATTETATAAATDAAAAATDAAAAAADAATSAAAAATDATTGGMMDTMTALTVENFDAAKVNAMIDASALGEGVKTPLKSAVDMAGQNKALIPSVITQVKSALGL